MFICKLNTCMSLSFYTMLAILYGLTWYCAWFIFIRHRTTCLLTTYLNNVGVSLRLNEPDIYIIRYFVVTTHEYLIIHRSFYTIHNDKWFNYEDSLSQRQASNDNRWCAIGCELWNCSDVIIGTTASQITSPTIVYSTVCSGAGQR